MSLSQRNSEQSLYLRQLLVDQVCSLAGGPCFYTPEEEWQTNLQYISDILKKRGVGEREQSEFLELFAAV